MSRKPFCPYAIMQDSRAVLGQATGCNHVESDDGICRKDNCPKEKDDEYAPEGITYVGIDFGKPTE